MNRTKTMVLIELRWGKVKARTSVITFNTYYFIAKLDVL